MPARRHAAVCGALLIALAVPAAADAATITTPLAPCYGTFGPPTNRQSQGFKITAEGFGVNSTVKLTIDGGPVLGPDGNPLINAVTGFPVGDALQANEAGVLDIQELVPAPWIEEGQRDFTVTLTDNVNPANTVSVTAKTTRLDVRLKPKVAKPHQRIRFTGSGFTDPRPVFAHYLYGGKEKATVRMARETGVCGTWDTRRRQIPVKEPASGLWTVQFDQFRKYRNGEKGKVDGVYFRQGISVRFERR